jgi:lysophospholipid hydrolase
MSTLGLKRSMDTNNPLGDLGKRQQDALGEDFDLRDAVMVSIAESIGLIQSSSPESTAPSGSESQGWSTPTSPNLPGFGARPTNSQSRNQSRSPFGNLSMLDMLQGNNTSGMSFKDRMTADDESSVTGTTTSASGRVGDLENDVQILYFKAGSTLVGEGEANPGLFFVIDGFLDVSISSVSDTHAPLDPVPAAMNEKRNSPDSQTDEKPRRPQEYLFTVKPGGIAGYLASLCGTPSYTNVTAKTDCYVGLLPHNSFERLLERRPIVLLTLAKRLISLLSPLVHDLDLALDWEQINAGQVLYREGDKSDSFYIVINGRLRAVHEQASGKVDLIAEYGQGSPIGELEAITDSTRPNTVHAIRDSELVKMPMTLFNAVSVQHPATTIRFLRLIASRVKQAAGPSLPQNIVAKPFSGTSGANLNLKTVCILPVTGSVPIAAFAERLRSALEDIGAPTAYLNQASVMRQLGRHAFSKMGKLKIAGWLAEREQRNRTVLYVVDTPVTSQWTLTSIRQVSSTFFR